MTCLFKREKIDLFCEAERDFWKTSILHLPKTAKANTRQQKISKRPNTRNDKDYNPNSASVI